MNYRLLFIISIIFLYSCQSKKAEEWTPLFNGKDLSGWKSNEHDDSFQVVDGMLVATGERSHLFYVGEDGDASFTNFELKAEIMTTYTANSGIYFHTQWQDEGWPGTGYEAQVNSTHKGAGDYKEVKKTASLYGIRNVYKALSQDSVWFEMRVRVEGKKVNIWINDIMTVDYLEPENSEKSLLTGGTFALQCHDPESKVVYKSILIKELPAPDEQNVPEEEAFPEILRLQANHFPVMDMAIDPINEPTIDNALQTFYSTGINLGFLSDSESSMESILANKPVFIGMKILLGDSFSGQVDDLKNIDYTVGQIPSFTDADVLNIDEFMKIHIANANAYLVTSPVDIIFNATLLPAQLMEGYREIWTLERMKELSGILKEHNVAIGIDCKSKYPDLNFIKVAKEQGCTFSFYNLLDTEGNANIDYLLEAVEYAGLDYKDVFIPGNM